MTDLQEMSQQLNRLNSLQTEIDYNFQCQTVKLEAKYQHLIKDITDQRFMIQQKLLDDYMKQTKKINDIKFELIQSFDCNQQKGYTRNLEKSTIDDLMSNNNENNNNDDNNSNSVDIPLLIKQELNNTSIVQNINVIFVIKNVNRHVTCNFI